jgi:hypothetical protein
LAVNFLLLIVIGKDEAISVTGREGPQVCGRSRLPHLLDRRLIDGGNVVNLTPLPPPPKKKKKKFLVLIYVGG